MPTKFKQSLSQTIDDELVAVCILAKQDYKEDIQVFKKDPFQYIGGLKGEIGSSLNQNQREIISIRRK